MPAPGPWMLCHALPDGEISCDDLTVPVIPVGPEWQDPPTGELGLLQDFLSQITDQRLKMELSIVLDESVARVGTLLPAGYEFRRAATHDFPDDPVIGADGTPVSVPDVVGLFVTDGYKLLRELGYDVAQEKDRTSPQTDIIVGQDPPADSFVAPPWTVTITVGWGRPPQDPPPPPDPQTIPPPGFDS